MTVLRHRRLIYNSIACVCVAVAAINVAVGSVVAAIICGVAGLILTVLADR